jgi:hypothetical protein
MKRKKKKNTAGKAPVKSPGMKRPGALLALTQPSGSGSYTVQVTDHFLPENTGVYEVRYQDGKTVSVEKSDGAYDLAVSVETFSQLAAGLYGLRTAAFRPGTEIAGKEDILNQVFHKKNVYTS